MIAAHANGIRVFVTGGIGGVHRGVADTGDVSSDLLTLSRVSVAVVSAGAKAILVGREVTPFLLDRMRAITGGASVRANVALLKNNARLGARLAVALSSRFLGS